MKNNSEASYYPNFWQGLGIVGIAILLMLLFSPVNAWLNGIVGNEASFLIYYLLSFGGTLGIAHLIRRRKTNYTKFDFSPGSIIMMALVSVTIIAIQFGIVTPIINLFPVPDYMREIMIQFANQKGVFSALAIVIAAPVIEEIIFRGIILDGFLRKYAPFKAIVLSSILFGVVHLNPWQFISALVLGLFSGWIYYKTKKLSLSILIHMVNNLVGFIGFYLIDVEAMMSEPVVELYGGATNFILITVSAILVAIVGIYLTGKELTK